jgi:membrane peptidoglycan carboxypeptidase
MKRHGWRRAAATAAVFGTISTLAFGIAAEANTSWLQAGLLSGFARQLGFTLEPGPSPSIRFPDAGPYDQRLGYVELPAFIGRRDDRGFVVEQQARLSERHRKLVDRGVFPIFREKTRAGLTILDRHDESVFTARFPGRIYESFEAVPPLVVDTLLFIENRELLAPKAERRNPAVEWDRLAAVLPHALIQIADPGHKAAGGSTLATQIEKYRHSPDGRTDHAVEKLRQITAASLRAYLDGPDTTATRRRIALDYLNSTPLSARQGLGEINGLGDGLHGWFGTSFEHANRVLRASAESGEALAEKARVYRQVLSLLLAQRRPSWYLLGGREDLARLADAYLRLLLQAGIVDADLAKAALDQPLRFSDQPPPPAGVPFVDLKAANAVRTELLSLLGTGALYQLDRLDLTARTSLDLATQERVTELLHRLDDPAFVQEQGLHGHRLLSAGISGSKLIVSLTLFERGEGANQLRVQADNLDQPFDLNKGAKLDLGSTAKLRTLITYLEIVATLHGRLAGLPPSELKAAAGKAQDPLTAWAADRLAAHPDADLASLLSAAMARRYSASPWERFFTGGGVHQFANFQAEDNGRVMTLAEAMRNSVNLVFIRLMRDVVKYYMAQGTPADDLLADASHPLRRAYLERFADREGRTFLNQFHGELTSLSPDGALEHLAGQVRARPDRLAVVFRSVRPGANRSSFAELLRARMPGTSFSEREIDRLYDRYGPDRFSLNDRGYIAGVHPLKLWLAAYWQEQPDPARVPRCSKPAPRSVWRAMRGCSEPAARPSRTSASASCSRRRRSQESTKPGVGSAIPSSTSCRPTPPRSAARRIGPRRSPS